MGTKAQSPVIKQGITGNVYQVTGNQMPGPGVPRKQPTGLQATVYIYEVTNISKTTRSGNAPLYSAIHTKLVTAVTTDSTGAFGVELAAGSYSLFVKQKELYYANSFDSNNDINVVKVEDGKRTSIKIMVSSAAYF